MSTYRPLPPQLTIKQSGIEGLGLFAVIDINSNTDLGLTHILDITQENGFIRTPLGGFINHSEDPSATRKQIRIEPYWDKWNVTTTKDIKKGEEITLKYTMYRVDNAD